MSKARGQPGKNGAQLAGQPGVPSAAGIAVPNTFTAHDRAAGKLKVFISYSRRDSSSFAEELLGGLTIAGFAPKLDLHDIATGEDWEARLRGLIHEADTVVFVVSPEAIRSERCQWEVDKTVALSKRLLPVVWIDVPEAEVPAKLKVLNYTHFSGGRSFTKALSELADALRLDLDWIREHTRLGELAARWARNKQADMLLRGQELEATNAWVKRRKPEAPEITEAQRLYVNASAEAETARASTQRQQLDEMHRAQVETANSQRRAGRLLWGVAALVLAMMGTVLWQSQNTVRRETLVYTSVAARALRDEQFDRGMRYALQAYPPPGHVPYTTHSPELEGKLAGGAVMSRLHVTLLGHTGTIIVSAFSPDGKRVVTASSDQTARLWDAESGKEIAHLKAHTDIVNAASFSPDGERVVTASDDQTARLWDAQSGKEIAHLKADNVGVLGASFSADGRRIITTGKDNVARIWDVSWVTVYGPKLRERVCAEKLFGAQDFTDIELEDPILRGIDRHDAIARNPCLRRGPLSLDYYTRLPGQVWRGLRAWWPGVARQ